MLKLFIFIRLYYFYFSPGISLCISLKPSLSPIIFFASQYNWDNTTPKYSHNFHSCCLSSTMIPCMWFTCSLKIIFIQDLERHSTAQFPRKITLWFPTRPMPFFHFAIAKCIITAKVRVLFFPSSPFPQMFPHKWYRLALQELTAMLYIPENIYFAFFFPQS